MNERVREAVAAGRLGHLVTLNPDGSPQVSAVWIGLDNDEIVVAHMMGGRKIRNIRRDPRVALSVEAAGSDSIGMSNTLIVYGKAYLTEGGAPELLQELAEVYLGPGVKFPPMENPPPGHVIRIVSERLAGIGPWKD